MIKFLLGVGVGAVGLYAGMWWALVKDEPTGRVLTMITGAIIMLVGILVGYMLGYGSTAEREN